MSRSSALSLLFLALCVLCCTASPARAQPSWSICPDAPTDIVPKQVTIDLVGRNLSYAMTATVDEQMTTGSTVTIAVTLGGAQIFTETLDMSVGTTLPIAANSTFVFKYGVAIPSIAPSGAYAVDLTFIDQTGVPLTCVAVAFNLFQRAIEEY